jgi:lysophospholipase L1-like esterase
MADAEKTPAPALPRLAAKIAAGETVTVVLYGDSISEVGRSPTWFGGASKAEANWGPVLATMLAEAYPQATFTVKHFGIGGQNSYEGLGRLDGLGPLEPDLVLVAFGANDCGYHYLLPEETGQALKALVEGIRARYQADVVLVGTGGDDPVQPAFRHLAETLAATAAAARETATPYVDLRTPILAATENGKRWADYHTAVGNCHPNDAGHRLWARSAFAVIRAVLAPAAAP